ncbi:hypothetical protein D3C72_1370130 [compost metagenome]
MAGPVLERLLDEVGERQDEAPVVPDAHDYEGAGDLLDPAPFALDHEHVVDADRLRQRDLQAGDEVAEDGLGRQARHDADHAGRGQQAGADLARAREGHEHHGAAGHDDDRHGGAREHAGLREHAACLQVVGDVRRVLREHAVGKAADGLEHEPGAGRDEQQPREMPHAADEAQVVRRRLPHHHERRQRQHQPRGGGAVEHHRMHGGRRAGDPPEDHAPDAVGEKGEGRGDQGGNPGAEPGVCEELLGHQAGVVFASGVLSFSG